MSDCPEEEYKYNIAQSNGIRMINNQNNLAPSSVVNDENVDMAAARGAAMANDADEHAAEMSESESIESSVIVGDNAEEESEYDEEAQWREEHVKLQQIFEKRDQRTSCISGSKVKLPYEMLINKLIDSLDTPDLVLKKELPIPAGLQS